MRIAFLTPEYVVPGNPEGGLANYLKRIGAELVARGHSVSVFLGSERDAVWRDGEVSIVEVAAPPVVPRVVLRGRILRYAPELAPAIGELLHARALARAFWRRHRDEPFDVVQASSYEAPGYALLGNGRVPVVCRISSHSPSYRAAFGLPTTKADRLRDWLELRQVVEADAVFSPSRLMADLFERTSGVRPEILRTAAVAADAAVVETALQPVPAKTGDYLVYFGTLSRTKGVDLFGSVVPALVRDRPGLRFLFVGRDHGLADGESLENRLRRTCGQFASALEFRGGLAKQELFALVRGAVGVVLPSRVDNYPNSCLEAQALGQIVVGSRGSSLDEMIVDGETGFLVENGDAESLRRGIEKLLALDAEGRRRMRARVLEEARRRETEDPVGRHVALYQRVIASFRAKAAAASPEERSRRTSQSAPRATASGPIARGAAAPARSDPPAGSLPLLSLCVCTFNRARRLATAIESIHARAIDPGDAEILVIDNSSTDGTREVVEAAIGRFPALRYVSEPEVGLSHARNRAVIESRGRYVGFLDDDAIAGETWLEIAREIARTLEPAAFGGPYHGWFDSPKPAWVKDEYYDYAHGELARPLRSHEFLGGGLLFFRRDRLDAVGGFDPRWGMRGEEIGYGEETDLQRRMRTAVPGDVIFYEPRLDVRHLVAPYKLTWSWLFKSAFVDGRHHYHVFERWQEGRWLRRGFAALVMLPVELVGSAVWRDRAAYPRWGNFVYESSLERVKVLGAGYEHLRASRARTPR